MRPAFPFRALALAIVSSVLIFGQAHGAGFAVYEQSTTGLGTAFAGSGVVADDASTIFFNPAGMVHLPGNNAVISVSPIFPTADYQDSGSETFNPFFNPNPPPDNGPPTFPTSGVTDSNGGTPAVVGTTYFSHQLSDQAWFGVGFNAPFGLTTEYDPDWVGRYHAIKSLLFTLNLNAAMAFKVSETFSMGVGLNLQYAYTNLTSSIDGGLLVPPAFGGPFPGAFDSLVDVTAQSLGFGANVGFLWEPLDGTRLGLHYRSPVSHDFSGDADVTVNPMTPVFPTWTTASADVTLPDTVSISALQQVTDDIDVVFDATWTNWSYLDALTIQFGSVLPDSTLQLNWVNTWRIAGGAIYRLDENWTFRAGYAYDETPVPSATFRTPRVPDNTRHWATIGASYEIDDHFEVSAAYAHLFVPDTPIASTDPTGLHELIGSYDSSTDIFSLQLTTSFEKIGQILD